MNGFMRFLLFVYSVFLALLSIILLFAMVDDGIFADLLSPLLAFPCLSLYHPETC